MVLAPSEIELRVKRPPSPIVKDVRGIKERASQFQTLASRSPFTDPKKDSPLSASGAKLGEDERVDPIRLRALPFPFREIPDLPRIHHHHRQPGQPQRRHERRLQTARSFEHNALRRQGLQLADELLDAFERMGRVPRPLLWPHRDRQRRQGHVDPHKALRRHVRLPRVASRPPCLGFDSGVHPRNRPGSARRVQRAATQLCYGLGPQGISVYRAWTLFNIVKAGHTRR